MEKHIPLQSDESQCDVVLVTKDQHLLFQASDLNAISKVFEEMLSLPNVKKINGRKVVDAEDTKTEIIIQALTFYFPKYFTKHVNGRFCLYKNIKTERSLQMFLVFFQFFQLYFILFC